MTSEDPRVGGVPARAARVGDVIAAGVRTSGYAEWNRFAAVNDEFVPIHMDDEEGRRAGYDGAIAMGRLQWSWAHRLLREWLDGQGRILSVRMRFRRPLERGAEFDRRARVIAERPGTGGGRELDLELWVEDAAGVVLAPGGAVVQLTPPSTTDQR